MDTLANAQQELAAARSAYDISEQQDGNAYWRSRSERHFQQATVYAAVAQVEQLKRIADALIHTNVRGHSFSVAEGLYLLNKLNDRE